MNLLPRFLAVGALASCLVATAGVGSAFAAGPLPVSPPRIDSVFTSDGQLSPLGEDGADQTAYLIDGRALVGGIVDTTSVPDAIELRDDEGNVLCADDSFTGGQGSYGWGCTLDVPAGDTRVTAVTVDGDEEAAASSGLRLTNYASATAPADTAAPGDLDPTSTPEATAEATDADRDEVVLHLSGQAMQRSTFAVTSGGKTRTVQGTDQGTGEVVIGDLGAGDNEIDVVQVRAGAKTSARTITVRNGEAETPSFDVAAKPSLQLGELFAGQRKATVVITGQVVRGSEFLVEANGVRQTLPASAGGTAIATVTNLRPGVNTVTVQQRSGTTVGAAATLDVRFGQAAPVAVSTTTFVPGVVNTVEGTAPANATIRIRNGGGSQIVPGDVSVDASGHWSFDRTMSKSAERFEFFVEVDGAQLHGPYTLVAAKDFLPPIIEKTTAIAGATNTFTGTAEAGASFRVLNISGTQIVPGEHTVAADGTWSFDRVVSKGATQFQFKLEVTKGARTVTTPLSTMAVSKFSPVTVTTKAVTAGESNTFAGTATANASYRVVNVSGTQIVPGDLQVAADGTWSFTRVVSKGASEFRFRIEQTLDGSSQRSGTFTLAAR